MGQYQDAQMILQFYELRRESRLREARTFVLGRFKAKSPGETQLVFRSVKALDSQGMPIPVVPEEAVVHVQEAP